MLVMVASLGALIALAGRWKTPSLPPGQEEVQVPLPRWRYDTPEMPWAVADLALHDGSTPGLPLLLSLGGVVFDVTAGDRFYGPGGPYHCFLAKPVSRALALGSLDPDDISKGDDVADFSDADHEELRERVRFYRNKYQTVGVLEESPLRGHFPA